MTEVSKASAPTAEIEVGGERRRSILPQPSFAYYEKANAYPGQGYFFVGHSYNVDLPKVQNDAVVKRSNAIKSLFQSETQWVPVQEALTSESFAQVLTRFEQDLLHRLPERALVGPAIDERGFLINQAFTVWRPERRKPRA